MAYNRPWLAMPQPWVYGIITYKKDRLFESKFLHTAFNNTCFECYDSSHFYGAAKGQLRGNKVTPPQKNQLQNTYFPLKKN